MSFLRSTVIVFGLSLALPSCHVSGSAPVRTGGGGGGTVSPPAYCGARIDEADAFATEIEHVQRLPTGPALVTEVCEHASSFHDRALFLERTPMPAGCYAEAWARATTNLSTAAVALERECGHPGPPVEGHLPLLRDALDVVLTLADGEDHDHDHDGYRDDDHDHDGRRDPDHDEDAHRDGLHDEASGGSGEAPARTGEASAPAHE